MRAIFPESDFRGPGVVKLQPNAHDDGKKNIVRDYRYLKVLHVVINGHESQLTWTQEREYGNLINFYV